MKANKNDHKKNWTEKGWVRWVLLGVIAICFTVNYCRIFDPKPDLNGDNFQYFLLAHSLAGGHGYVSEIGPTPVPHMHFPPGYPAFMSLFLRLFPDNIIAMKILNGLLFLLSLFLLFRIIRKTAGPLGLAIAFVGCILCTAHPELLRWATIMMSEMLYLAVSLGIIALCIDLDVERAFHGDWRNILRLLGICLLVAFTYFIRTMGISVVLAVVLVFFVLAVKDFARRKELGGRWIRKLAVCGLVVASLAIAWESWNLRNQQVMPGYESEYMNNFKYTREGNTMDSMDLWGKRLGTNLRVFTAFFIPNSVLQPDLASQTLMPVKTNALGWVLGILVIAVVLIGILSLQGISLLVLFYFLITFGVLMLYQEQYAGTRYFVPLIPLMLCAAVAGLVRIADWVRRLWTRRPQTWLAFAVLVAILAVGYPAYVHQQESDRNIAAIKNYVKLGEDNQLGQFVKASDWVRQNSTPDVLVSCRKPEVFHFYSGYRHAISFPNNATPEEVVDYMRENQVDVVIMDSWFPNAYRTILPAAQKYPDHFQVLTYFGQGGAVNPTYVLLFKP